MKSNITKPVLLLDEKKVRRNVQRMKERAQEAGSVLRPHFKTHQSHTVGEWCREEGIEGITVSSVGMAVYFASAGWKDILIAFPVNIRELAVIKDLSAQLDRLILLVEHKDTVSILASSGIRVDVVVEIDTGSKRTGLWYSDKEGIESLVGQIEATENLSLAGVYSHAGHTYRSRGIEEVTATGGEALSRLEGVGRMLNRELPVYFGDTPYASIGTDLEKVTVMTPGNFVYYDTMQIAIGACGYDDIAVCLACPVVSLKADRNEIAVYAGAVHLSKDKIEDDTFGAIVRITETGWTEPLSGCYVRAISQEHGLVHISDEYIDQWKIGDLLGILPVHSCLTAEAMGEYETITGKVIDHFQKHKNKGR